MKAFNATTFVIVSGLIVSACNEETVNTVEYYQNNKDIRITKLEECKKTGAKNDAGYTANCQNAAKAERIADVNKPRTNFFK